MPRTVTARFASEEEAERALSAVAAEVPLRDSAVVGSGPAGSLMLDSLYLTPTERAACDQQLSKTGFLLVAQVASEGRGEAVLGLLNNMHVESVPSAPALAPQAGAALWDEAGPRRSDGVERESEPQVAEAAAPAPESALPTAEAAPLSDEASAPVAEAATPVAEAVAPVLSPGGIGKPADEYGEERIPMVEEELRVGKREVVRGRSRVRTFVAEIPVQEQVELLYEETHLRRRPVNRRVSDEEVEQGGLLQERVIEITEMGEEAVVTKEAFVREELVVTKSLHRRVEQIDETVRRTEVETERMPPG